MSGRGPAPTLLEAVAAFYRVAAGDADDGTAAMLSSVCAELDRAVEPQPPATPRAIAAAALLADALREARPATLARAIGQCSPRFHWRQNPNYTAAHMSADFTAGYGYVEFAGPKEALFRARGIRVGLLLLGPRLHYPLHAHPAEEIYHPLTDGGLWRRGEDEWRTVPAGEAIHHLPLVPHETRAMDRTLLALYCWRGDMATEARLSR